MCGGGAVGVFNPNMPQKWIGCPESQNKVIEQKEINFVQNQQQSYPAVAQCVK